MKKITAAPSNMNRAPADPSIQVVLSDSRFMADRPQFQPQWPQPPPFSAPAMDLKTQTSTPKMPTSPIMLEISIDTKNTRYGLEIA